MSKIKFNSDTACPVKLTVLLPTYNHHQYIAECLDSILAQETRFPFNIYVLDDASTDGTTDIVRAYAKKYPHCVRHDLRPSNVGAVRNIFMGMCSVDSEYFAFVEGDDYWTDTSKLQQQVDALDANPDVDVCGHNTVMKNLRMGEQELHVKKHYLDRITRLVGIENLVRPHPSARVFRNVYDYSGIKNIDAVTYDTTMFWYFCLQNPKMIYIDLRMSVYNFTGTGVFSGAHNKKRKHMALSNIVALNEALEGRFEAFSYKRFMKALPRKYRLSFWFRYRFNKAQAYAHFVRKYQ